MLRRRRFGRQSISGNDSNSGNISPGLRDAISSIKYHSPSYKNYGPVLHLVRQRYLEQDPRAQERAHHGVPPVTLLRFKNVPIKSAPFSPPPRTLISFFWSAVTPAPYAAHKKMRNAANCEPRKQRSIKPDSAVGGRAALWSLLFSERRKESLAKRGTLTASEEDKDGARTRVEKAGREQADGKGRGWECCVKKFFLGGGGGRRDFYFCSRASFFFLFFDNNSSSNRGVGSAPRLLSRSEESEFEFVLPTTDC